MHAKPAGFLKILLLFLLPLRLSLALLPIVLSLTLLPFVLSLTGCESFEKIREPKPLTGENVHVYSLANGRIEFRMKVSGLTSTLWISAELINLSDDNLTFDPEHLLRFDDPECLEDREYEKIEKNALGPQESQVMRYTFRLYARKKSAPQYAQCKEKPLKFKVDGLLLNNLVVQPLTLTIEN